MPMSQNSTNLFYLFEHFDSITNENIIPFHELSQPIAEFVSLLENVEKIDWDIPERVMKGILESI